jgi:hypothetical protein
MKQALVITAAKALAVAGLVLATPLASAGGHGDVSWSVSVGSSYPAPRVYSPPPVVYVEPEPVYVQPRPVYVQPRPVYVRPGPVVFYDAPVVRYGQPYYVEEVRYEKFKHHHWKRHHHHDHDD